MLWFKMNLYSKFDDWIPEQMVTTILLLNIRIKHWTWVCYKPKCLYYNFWATCAYRIVQLFVQVRYFQTFFHSAYRKLPPIKRGFLFKNLTGSEHGKESVKQLSCYQEMNGYILALPRSPPNDASWTGHGCFGPSIKKSNQIYSHCPQRLFHIIHVK